MAAGGDDKIEKEFFPWLRRAQQWWGGEISLQLFERLLALGSPFERPLQRAEEGQASVRCP